MGRVGQSQDSSLGGPCNPFEGRERKAQEHDPRHGSTNFERKTVNTKEKMAVGMGIALIGLAFMKISDPSISTVGSILVGMGLTLFLTNLKD